MAEAVSWLVEANHVALNRRGLMCAVFRFRHIVEKIMGYFPQTSIIHSLAKVGDHRSLKFWMESCSPDINMQDCDGNTALHMAVIGGHVEVFRLLLKYHARVSLRNHENLRAIDLVSKYGRLEMLDLIRDKYGILDDPVYFAAEGNQPLMIHVLHKIGFDIDGKNIYRAPIHHAIAHNSYQAVRMLVKLGADIEVKFNNSTPYEIAIRMGRTKIAKFLISKGVNQNFRSYDGFMEIRCAVMNGDAEMCEMFKDQYQHLNCNSSYRRIDKKLARFLEGTRYRLHKSFLELAIEYKNYSTAMWLLDQGEIVSKDYHPCLNGDMFAHEMNTGEGKFLFKLWCKHKKIC